MLAYLHNLGTDTDKSGRLETDDFLPFTSARRATLEEVDAGAIRIKPHLRFIRSLLLKDAD